MGGCPGVGDVHVARYDESRSQGAVKQAS
jgi:hypothetical protein